MEHLVSQLEVEVVEVEVEVEVVVVAGRVKEGPGLLRLQRSQAFAAGQ